MCALCGVLGGPEHWTDAVARPGVFTRNTDAAARRRERMNRVAAANRVTLALNFDQPIDWTRFGIWLTMLLHRHGDALLRVKGILNVADAATPVAVHGCSISCIRRGIWARGPMGIGARVWYSSPEGSIRR